MTHRTYRCCCSALAASPHALSQLPGAQQRDNQALTYCNSDTFARPECDACIRDAGIALDQCRADAPPADINVAAPRAVTSLSLRGERRRRAATPARSPRPMAIPQSSCLRTAPGRSRSDSCAGRGPLGSADP